MLKIYMSAQQRATIHSTVRALQGFDPAHDTLDFTELLSASSVSFAQTINASTADGTTIAPDTVVLVQFGQPIAGLDFGDMAFLDLFGTTGQNKYISTTLPQAGEAVLLVQGTDRSEVYYINSTNTTISSPDVTLIGIIDGVSSGWV